MKIAEDTKEKLVQFKNILLILLIIIDLIFIVAITVSDLPAEDIEFMAFFDLFVCVMLFLNLVIEYYKRDGSRWQFLKSHIVDIISIIPFNFIFLRYLTLFRAFRIIQVFQVIRIINIKKVNVHSFKFFVQNQLLRLLTIVLIIYMVISSIILFTIDSSFSSVFESFWYGLVTITGVGYGDFTPVSNAGKVIGMLTIIIGVLFISVFTAATSAIYMEKNEQETRTTVEYNLSKIKKENEELHGEISKLNKKIDDLTELIKEKN